MKDTQRIKGLTVRKRKYVSAKERKGRKAIREFEKVRFLKRALESYRKLEGE